jgi:hypothetical protein
MIHFTNILSQKQTMTTRLTGLLFHRFSGLPGWSRITATGQMDVGYIHSITWHKRDFIVCDHNHPYTLTIEWTGPWQGVIYTPGITTVITQVSIRPITLRYKTGEDIVKEINLVLDKQRQLDEIRASLLNQK